MSDPYRTPPECDHGVVFNATEWSQLGEAGTDVPPIEVRRRWPRLEGECPLGCGYRGIAYASMLHYLAGDW